MHKKNFFKKLKNELIIFLMLQLSSVQLLSHVQLFATPWTLAHQAPLSMGILQTRMLEWVAMPSSRESSNPGIEPRSPVSQADLYHVIFTTRKAQFKLSYI